MKRKKVLLTVVSALALGLTVWTIGATVNLSTIGFSVSSGDVVSADDFNNAFAAVDANFADTEAAINEHHAEQPGAAQAFDDATPVNFDGTLQTVMSLDIDVPSSGFVIVTASGYIELNHTNTVGSNVQFGVSADPSTMPPAQDINTILPATAASGNYSIPFTAQRVFEVATPGATSFHLLAQRTGGANGRMADVTVTAMYVPNVYGAIATTSSIQSVGADDR